MGDEQAPGSYEAITRRIHDEFDALSRTNQQIARYLTQSPNDVALHSISVLAERCEVHPSSFVRFAQHFGYRGFKQLQAVYQARLITAAPGFTARTEALKSELASDARSSSGDLADLVARDIASLEELLEGIAETDVQRAAALMQSADVIYLLGQLRSEPIVGLLRYLLTMLGKRAVLLDASGGLATHMAGVMQPNDLLLVVSFRFYATEVVNITENCAQQRVPIVAISDTTLSPLAKSADILFAIPEHDYTFSRSLAAPMCLAQALMVALARELQRARGDDAEASPRLPVATAQQLD